MVRHRKLSQARASKLLRELDKRDTHSFEDVDLNRDSLRRELQDAASEYITMYDPPSGWRYGFPRQYLPLSGETLVHTLLRDGYPQHEINNGGAEHVRFWDVPVGTIGATATKEDK